MHHPLAIHQKEILDGKAFTWLSTGILYIAVFSYTVLKQCANFSVFTAV